MAFLKCYYDGSGKDSDPSQSHMTLAGYIGTLPAWDAFEISWGHILDYWGTPRLDDSATCTKIHMSDMYTFNGEFTRERGWTKEKVDRLLCDLFNHCFNHAGRNSFEGQFRGAAVTIKLDDYKRACRDYPDLRKIKNAYAISVDFVASAAFAMLPASETGPHGKDGLVEFLFDRSEDYEKQLRPAWDRKKAYFRLIGTIGSTTSEAIGIQAADVLSWCTNRAHVSNDSFFGIAPLMACPTSFAVLGYEEIVDRYKRALDLIASEPRHR